MQKFVAVAIGSVVALVGFAGAANASATIDLIWTATGTDTSPIDVQVSSNITLEVILTAGPGGSLGVFTLKPGSGERTSSTCRLS